MAGYKPKSKTSRPRQKRIYQTFFEVVQYLLEEPSPDSISQLMRWESSDDMENGLMLVPSYLISGHLDVFYPHYANGLNLFLFDLYFFNRKNFNHFLHHLVFNITGFSKKNNQEIAQELFHVFYRYANFHNTEVSEHMMSYLYHITRTAKKRQSDAALFLLRQYGRVTSRGSFIPNGSRLSFFINGSQAEKATKLLQYLIDRGHTNRRNTFNISELVENLDLYVFDEYQNIPFPQWNLERRRSILQNLFNSYLIKYAVWVQDDRYYINRQWVLAAQEGKEFLAVVGRKKLYPTEAHVRKALRERFKAGLENSATSLVNGSNERIPGNKHAERNLALYHAVQDLGLLRLLTIRRTGRSVSKKKPVGARLASNPSDSNTAAFFDSPKVNNLSLDARAFGQSGARAAIDDQAGDDFEREVPRSAEPARTDLELMLSDETGNPGAPVSFDLTVLNVSEALKVFVKIHKVAVGDEIIFILRDGNTLTAVVDGYLMQGIIPREAVAAVSMQFKSRNLVFNQMVITLGAMVGREGLEQLGFGARLAAARKALATEKKFRPKLKSGQSSLMSVFRKLREQRVEAGKIIEHVNRDAFRALLEELLRQAPNMQAVADYMGVSLESLNRWKITFGVSFEKKSAGGNNKFTSNFNWLKRVRTVLEKKPDISSSALCEIFSVSPQTILLARALIEEQKRQEASAPAAKQSVPTSGKFKNILEPILGLFVKIRSEMTVKDRRKPHLDKAEKIVHDASSSTDVRLHTAILFIGNFMNQSKTEDTAYVLAGEAKELLQKISGARAATRDSDAVPVKALTNGRNYLYLFSAPSVAWQIGSTYPFMREQVDFKDRRTLLIGYHEIDYDDAYGISEALRSYDIQNLTVADPDPRIKYESYHLRMAMGSLQEALQLVNRAVARHSILDPVEATDLPEYTSNTYGTFAGEIIRLKLRIAKEETGIFWAPSEDYAPEVLMRVKFFRNQLFHMQARWKKSDYVEGDAILDALEHVTLALNKIKPKHKWYLPTEFVNNRPGILSLLVTSRRGSEYRVQLRLKFWDDGGSGDTFKATYRVFLLKEGGEEEFIGTKNFWMDKIDLHLRSSSNVRAADFRTDDPGLLEAINKPFDGLVGGLFDQTNPYLQGARMAGAKAENSTADGVWHAVSRDFLAQAVLAQGARFSSAGMKRKMAIYFDDLSLLILNLSSDGKYITANAEGFESMRFDARQVIRNAADKPVGAVMDVKDVMALLSARDEAVRRSLGEVRGVDRNRSVLLGIRVEVFGNLKKETLYFDIAALQLVRIRRNYAEAKNAHFRLEGNADQIKVAVARLEELAALYPRLGLENLFDGNESSALNLSHVHIVPANKRIKKPEASHRYLPMRPVKA